MLRAARELFVDAGYPAATLAAIAERADVALPTLYAAFGAKHALLAALFEDGGPEAFPRIDAEAVRELGAVSDPAARLRGYARLIRQSLARSTDLLIALRVAAAGEAAAAHLERGLQGERHDAARVIASGLNADGALRTGMSVRTAADTLWAITDVQTYALLVTARGWAPARFEKWLGELLVNAVLEAP